MTTPSSTSTTDCYCPLHLGVYYSLGNAHSRLFDLPQAVEHLAAAEASGSHVHRARSAYIAEQRATSNGGTGYVRCPAADLTESGFRSLCGIGFGSIRTHKEHP